MVDNNFQNIKNIDNLKKDFTLMILPGNDGIPVSECHWYWWLKTELEKNYPFAQIICEDMPDPLETKDEIWTPFILKKLDDYLHDPNKKVYIVGHSSGAVCLMRLMENIKITGGVIVAGCVTHLNLEIELNSGYYPTQPHSNELRPWLWKNMKTNTKWILNFAAEDDCFVNISEMREIRDSLELKENHIEFNKEQGKSHFMYKEFPELLEILMIYINKDFEI